jgi:hypothetical protein
MTSVTSDRTRKKLRYLPPAFDGRLIGSTYTTSGGEEVDRVRLATLRGDGNLRLGFPVGDDVVALTTVEGAQNQGQIPLTPGEPWPGWEAHRDALGRATGEAENPLATGIIDRIADPDPPVPNRRRSSESA